MWCYYCPERCSWAHRQRFSLAGSGQVGPSQQPFTPVSRVIHKQAFGESLQKSGTQYPVHEYTLPCGDILTHPASKYSSLFYISLYPPCPPLISALTFHSWCPPSKPPQLFLMHHPRTGHCHSGHPTAKCVVLPSLPHQPPPALCTPLTITFTQFPHSAPGPPT